MTLIAERLSHHGMPQEKIKYELFKSDQPGRLALKTKTNASDQKHGDNTRNYHHRWRLFFV